MWKAASTDWESIARTYLDLKRSEGPEKARQYRSLFRFKKERFDLALWKVR